MTKLSEILEMEGAPRDTAVQKRTVRIVKTDAFLRAYDWSAWLLKRSGVSLNAGLDKGYGTSHIFVGFPVSSADKFAPEGSEAVKDGDGVPTEWILPATKFPPEELYPTLDDDYASWLGETLAELESEQAERKQKKTTEKHNATARGRRAREDDIAVIEDVSASPHSLGADYAYDLFFYSDRVGPADLESRYYGCSVRLVCDVPDFDTGNTTLPGMENTDIDEW